MQVISEHVKIMVVLRCTQPLNKWGMHRLQIVFETSPFCNASTICTQISVLATSTRPFGKFGGKSPIQLSSQTHFAKT